MSAAPIHLSICGLFEITHMLDTNKFDAILSITDPPVGLHSTGMCARRRRRIRKHCENALCLAFDDVVHPTPEALMPSLHHVVQIVEFARSIQPGSKVLVHCMAGISRSTAASIIILREMGMTYDNAHAHVVAVRPQAQPNGLMLHLHANVLVPPPIANDNDDGEPRAPAPAVVNENPVQC